MKELRQIEQKVLALGRGQAVADSLQGSGTAPAKAWLKTILQRWRHGQATHVVRQLEQRSESQTQRAAEQQEIVAREGHYFQAHADQLHYRAREQAGAPLGGGAQLMAPQLFRPLVGHVEIGALPLVAGAESDGLPVAGLVTGAGVGRRIGAALGQEQAVAERVRAPARAARARRRPGTGWRGWARRPWG